MKKKLPRDGRYELVAQKLEERIRSGELRPGDCLPSEEKLGKEFSFSRTVIREALQAMKSKGILKSRRGSGTYVAKPESSSIGQSISWYAEMKQEGKVYLELMDLRMVVETHCVRQLAEGTASIEGVRRCLDVMEKNATNLKAFAEADIDFHLAISKASAHSLFNVVAQAVLPALGRPFSERTTTDVQVCQQTLNEHRKIFAALEARDPDKAERAMRTHLQRSRRDLLKRLDGK